MIYKLTLQNNNKSLKLGIGDWGLGIAIPNPQSPIPNPHLINKSYTI